MAEVPQSGEQLQLEDYSLLKSEYINFFKQLTEWNKESVSSKQHSIAGNHPNIKIICEYIYNKTITLNPLLP